MLNETRRRTLRAALGFLQFPLRAPELRAPALRRVLGIRAMNKLRC